MITSSKKISFVFYLGFLIPNALKIGKPHFKQIHALRGVKNGNY